jgi:hypothetical protein
MNLRTKISLFTLTAILMGTASFSNPSMAKEYKEANDKKVNIYTSPISDVFRAPNIGADFKISKSLTLGGSGSYIKATAGSLTAKAYVFTVRGTHYFSENTFTDSWIARAELGYLSGKITDSNPNNSNSGSMKGYIASALAGYHWQWENGFNMELLGGIAAYSVKTNAKSDAKKISFAHSGLAPALSFGIGYAF